MHTVYTLNTEELDDRFISSLKAAFPSRKVTIEVSDEAAEDTTGYLLKSPVNREHLITSMAEAQSAGTLVEMSSDELDRHK